MLVIQARTPVNFLQNPVGRNSIDREWEIEIKVGEKIKTLVCSCKRTPFSVPLQASEDWAASIPPGRAYEMKGLVVNGQGVYFAR